MVGIRKVKHFSLTLFLFGTALITLSFKWFSDQTAQHPSSRALPHHNLSLPRHPPPPPHHHHAHSPPSPHLPKASAPGTPREQQTLGEKAASSGRNDLHVENENPDKADPHQQPPPSKNINSPASDSKNEGVGERSRRNSPLKYSDPRSSGANAKQTEWEKQVAKRIVSHNKQNSPPHGKRVLRDEDLFVENRGPDGDGGVTRKVDVRRLHRSFSLAALQSGNVYTTTENEPGSKVIHVAVFAGRDAFTALMTLVNSVMKNSPFRNVTFHFVTATAADRMTLKTELQASVLSGVAYEIIEYPPEWSQGKNLLEFAPFRLPELLPYMGGRVIVLDPYCLVKGDISELAGMHINRGHWAAMATLCNLDPTSNMPEERYKHYLNFSHEAIAQLHLSPDMCVPSPAVMVTNINAIRLANARRQMWQWMHRSDKTPVFLKTEKGAVSSKAAYTVVYHNHTTPMRPHWYTRVSEQSPPLDGEHSLYHWTGTGNPWESSSPVNGIWKAFLVRSTHDSASPADV